MARDLLGENGSGDGDAAARGGQDSDAATRRMPLT